MSRITIRAALQHLVREGFLIKQPGRGTFVRQRKERQRLHVGFLVIGCDLRDPLFAAVQRGAENAVIEHEWVLHYQRIPYRPRAGQRMHPGSPGHPRGLLFFPLVSTARRQESASVPR